jgi:hypothetical protein
MEYAMTQKWKVSFEVPAEKLSDVLAPLSASVGNFDLSPIIKVPFERNKPQHPRKSKDGRGKNRGQASATILKFLAASAMGKATRQEMKTVYEASGHSPSALFSRQRSLQEKGFIDVRQGVWHITDRGRQELNNG